MVATVQLTGDALFGIHRPLQAAALLNAQPQTVKLGRLPMTDEARAKYASKLSLSRYFTLLGSTPPPDSVDYAEKAQASIARMYLNDTYGDCVIASKAHMFGVMTGNDAPAVALATDKEISTTYFSWCGPGDNGCVITDVMDKLKSKGMPMSGVLHKIDDYVTVDHTNKDLVKAAIYCFGNITLGINLPSTWTNSAVWDLTNSRIVGGHDVQCVGYNAQGVQISSWGKIYTITWAAFTSTRYLDEAYVALAPDWYGSDKLAPTGVDVDKLKTDLALVESGQMPDIEPPVPVPPDPVDPPGPGPTPVPPPTPTPTKFPNYVGTAHIQTKILGQTVDVTVPITLKPQF